MKNMCLAFTTFTLAACGGGSTPPDMTKPAIAEAMTTLEAAKPVIDRAYRDNGRAFPLTANAPISTAAPANSKYVVAVAYNSIGRAGPTSVVLTLGGTGNSIVDGAFVGVFGTGQADGTVNWICGTSAAATGIVPAAATLLYPYLPAPCQH
jgi:type IV pilus assembly protein PilA